MADPKQNSKGYVVLKHSKTGAVQEFVPESVDAWKASGWAEASENDIKKAAESDGAEVDLGAAVQPKKEN
jgi:hypothetical protein